MVLVELSKPCTERYIFIAPISLQEFMDAIFLALSLREIIFAKRLYTPLNRILYNYTYLL